MFLGWFYDFVPIFNFKLQELKANPDRNARGTVIEAGIDKSKGPLATVIVQNGTLRRGNIVVCGEAFGKVCRILFKIEHFRSFLSLSLLPKDLL